MCVHTAVAVERRLSASHRFKPAIFEVHRNEQSYPARIRQYPADFSVWWFMCRLLLPTNICRLQPPADRLRQLPSNLVYANNAAPESHSRLIEPAAHTRAPLQTKLVPLKRARYAITIRALAFSVAPLVLETGQCAPTKVRACHERWPGLNKQSVMCTSCPTGQTLFRQPGKCGSCPSPYTADEPHNICALYCNTSAGRFINPATQNTNNPSCVACTSITDPSTVGYIMIGYQCLPSTCNAGYQPQSKMCVPCGAGQITPTPGAREPSSPSIVLTWADAIADQQNVRIVLPIRVPAKIADPAKRNLAIRGVGCIKASV